MLALRGTAMPSPSVLRLRGAATLSPSVLWELGFCVLSMLQGCCLSPDSGPGPLWVPAARGVLVSGNFATLQQSEEPGWPMSVQRAVCGEPCGFGIKPSGKILGCLVFCWGGGGEREEQITSNVGLNSFLVALGRFVKNVIEGNKVNRALRQSERCRPCWGVTLSGGFSWERPWALHVLHALAGEAGHFRWRRRRTSVGNRIC